MSNVLTEIPVTHPYPGLTRRILTCTEASMLVEHHMEKGSVFPLHSHPHEQTVYILEGELVVESHETNGIQERHARSGDSWVVPGNIKHRVTALTFCRVLDFFTPFREDYVEKK